MYIFCHSVISGKFQKSSLLWVYILWRSCSKCLYNCYIDTLQCSVNVYNNNVRFRAMCSSFQMWQRNTEEPIIALPPTWLVSIVILNVSSHFFEAKKILPSNIDSTFHFQVGTGARRNINVEVNTLIFTAWTWRMVAWFGDNSRVPQLTCIWMSLPEASGLGNLTRWQWFVRPYIFLATNQNHCYSIKSNICLFKAIDHSVS